MKKPMKLLRNLLLGTFTMALWFGVNSQTVKAEADISIMPYEITIDYEHQQLILAERDNRDVEVFCEFGTRKTVTTGKGSNRQSRDICNFYTSSVYDYKNGMVIDLSSLKREKDCYIRLYGNYSEEPITIKIPAINTAVKAKFEPVNGIVKMYDYTDKNDVVQFTTEAVEYRNVYGNWQKYEYIESYDIYDDLSGYQQRGATLYFRLKAEAAQQLHVTAPDITYGDVEDADGEDIPVYEASSFPGKEVKVVIPQLPAAPKVTVDYNGQRFTLPKGTQYRVASANNSNMQWVSAKKTSALQLDLADLTETYGKNDNSALEVRFAKTEKNPASKINRIRIAEGKTPTVESRNTDTSVTVSKQSIDKNCLKDEFGAEVLVAEYVYNVKKKQCTGVRFRNDLEEAYEICAVRGGGTPSPSGAGVQTIKAWTAKMTDSAVTTIPISKLRDGSKVYIRRKADIKAKQFSSSWTLFGVVSYPEEDPEY